ncbi:cysteine desulfurase family protein [Buchananella hordeovulneris]|uniref:cysteine desulfurase family protein n=1 Tax=Buchananella hordeovulneris TaxID=52770 RepID=UPI000F5EA9B8|nr:aminotransferase class V-fold PLP-dependent enzyme [Buchananella hordeovulneris]MDO5080430.1 aminotransferase class V-fold PLP-dependent enzyme [Buchananella hordeovulneris]RRD45084.1 aminotransferase class V-fold PLP-dependent enzyme [Buchananella hordeovulneris]
MIYLDHAATSPPGGDALQAYTTELAHLAAQPGNSAALHAGGRAARGRLETARAQLARLLGAARRAVLFVSGATEGNLLAVAGRVAHWRAAGQPTIALCLTTDHPSLRGAVRALPGAHGLIEVERAGQPRAGWTQAVAAAAWRALGNDGPPPPLPELTSRFRLVVGFATVNNETGAYLDPAAAVAALRQAGVDWIHVDAAQAIGSQPVDCEATGIDSLTFSGHKLGTPPGCGALVTRRDALAPVYPGAGQEFGLRSGTVDVASARALSAAVAQALRDQAVNVAHWQQLAARLRQAATAEGWRPTLASSAPSSPHIVSLIIPGAPSEALLTALDMAGVAVSAGSACQAGVVGPSEVLLAMGHADADARCVVRVSFGPHSTAAEVETLITKLRAAAPAAARFGAGTRP